MKGEYNMSENTNTPSGDSKQDIYTFETAKGVIYVGFYGLIEKNPELENDTSANPGSNTIVNLVEVGGIEEFNEKDGYVGVQVQDYNLKLRRAIEARAEKSRADKSRTNKSKDKKKLN